MSDELCWLPATALARAYRAREISPIEVVDAVLDRLERVNPELNAFVTVTADAARRQARAAADAFVREPGGEHAPLLGIPITIKDLTNTAGIRTTYGSPVFADHVPTTDSVAWARIKRAGAILIGKPTTPDFGLLGITESLLTGTTNNPWDTTRTTGGSSGGSAAAVAAGIAPLSWGSDGGGSIRLPSSLCGTVGLKASSGRIPRLGDGPAYDTVATAGPITRTVADNALLLDVTAGPDLREPLSLPAARPGEFSEAARSPVPRGLRVGYSPDLGFSTVAADVRAVFDAALTTFADDLGAVVEPVAISLPDPIDYFLHYWGPEYAAAVDELADVHGFDVSTLNPMVLDIAAYAKNMSAAEYYHAAFDIRADIAAGYAAVFEHHDLLLTPTTPVSAFAHTPDGGPRDIDGTRIENWPGLHFTSLTESPSHAGIPAVSVPCGFTGAGLPVGLQVIAAPHDDAGVLQAAASYQNATSWLDHRPAVGGRDERHRP